MRRLLVGLGLVGIAVGLWLWMRGGSDREPSKAPAGGTASGSMARPAAKRAAAKPAHIGGKVTRRADGGAVAGAVIAIARAELGADIGTNDTPTIVVTSDESGAWEAAQVPAGEYIIAATARGLLPSKEQRVTLGSEERRTIDIVLDAGGVALRGTVGDVGGGPIANARVTAQRSEFRLAANPELVTLTGADGTYELTLAEGEYRVTAEHDDYTSVRKTVEMSAPQTLDFSLVPGAVIRGQVVARDTRKPVPHAVVKAEGRRRFAGGREAIADAEGKFALRGLSSGAASITARARGYASTSPTIVQIGIGEEVEDVQVLVDGAFSITGRVVKARSQEPVAGARVGAFSMKGQQADAPDPTDEDGAFEIWGVRPGSYMLYTASEHAVIEVGKPSVEVVDKDVTGVVVELDAGVTLAGRVEPPGVASVALEMEGEVGLANMFQMVKVMLVRGDSDETGAFTLKRVPAGKFRLVARTKQGNTGKLAVVVADVDQQGLVVTLEKRASIAGRVVDTKGKPVANITVSASPADEKPFSMAAVMNETRDFRSAADGSFKIVGLEAGAYRVRGRVRDDFDIDVGKAKDKSPAVTVAAGEDKTGVTVTVEARDGVIRGVVVGSDGKPASDAWVTARRERDTSALPENVRVETYGGEWWSATEPVLAMEGGKFTIANLREGSYTVVAEGPRGSSRGEVKGVKTGSSTTVKLASLGTLAVAVTQGGTPVKTYDLSCDSNATDVERHAVTEDGVYTVENLAPAEYTCKVDAETGTGEGKVTVPSGDAKLAINLAGFGSLTGVVVNVLTSKPVPGLSIIPNTRNGRDFMEAMTGRGVKTDAAGTFVLERVPAGKGSIMILGRDQSLTNIESREYEAKEGQRVDLGTIKIAPPRTTEAGTFGMATEVKGDVIEVTSVEPDKPAAQAGIVAGDKIVAVEGVPLKGVAEVAKKLLSSGVVGIGQTYKLTLERGATVAVTSVKW